MSARLAVIAFVAGLLTLGGPAHAQKQPAPEKKRLVYPVRHAAAKELAAALGKHFRGEAEVEAVADGQAGYLLISAAPGAFAEVVKTVEQLDRAPRSVAVEILIAEVLPGRDEAGKPAPAKDLDPAGLSGPINDVLARVNGLRGEQRLGVLKRVQLTVTENQPATAIVSESKPFVTGLTASPFGKGAAGGAAPRMSRNIMYREIGTQVKLQLRVSPDELVSMDLNCEDTQGRVSQDGVLLGMDENGVPIRATEFITARLKAQLSVRSGHAVLAKGVQMSSKTGHDQTLVVVTARVIEPGAAVGRKP